MFILNKYYIVLYTFYFYHVVLLIVHVLRQLLNPVPLQLTGLLEPLHEYLDDVGALLPNEWGPLAGCGLANRSDRWPGNIPMQSWSRGLYLCF